MIAGRLAIAALALAVALAATRPHGGDSGLRLTSASKGSLVHANGRDAHAVLAAANMHPGQTEAGLVRIANGRNAGHLSLAAAPPADRPGPGGGRLSDQLVLRIEDVTDPRRPRTIAAGHPAGACRALGKIRAKAARVYRFTATLPRGAGNAYALASTRVDYRWLESDAPVACPPAGAAKRTRSRHHRRTHTIRASSRHGR